MDQPNQTYLDMIKNLEDRIVKLESEGKLSAYLQGDWLLSKSMIKRAVSIVLHQIMLSIVVFVVWWFLMLLLVSLSR